MFRFGSLYQVSWPSGTFSISLSRVISKVFRASVLVWHFMNLCDTLFLYHCTIHLISGPSFQGWGNSMLMDQTLPIFHLFSFLNLSCSFFVYQYCLCFLELELNLEDISAIRQLDEEGRTPLLYACSVGALEIVECLLTHGSSLDEVDMYGGSAFLCAADGGSVEMVCCEGYA